MSPLIVFALLTGEAPATPPAPPATPKSVWTVELRGGYAGAFSTGVSHLGMGEGLAVGRTFDFGLHRELEGFHFEGSRQSAADSTEKYVASYQSFAVQSGAGWEFRAGPVRLRPGVELGAAIVTGHTKLGTLTLHDDVTRLMFGPAFAAWVPLAMVRLGVEGQGLFVPSVVAAPTLAMFAVIGVEL